MIAFMTLIYTAVVATVFFVFKVKPRPYPVAITVLVGVLMIGGVVILWLPSAPISSNAVVTRYVVQLVPWVKGQVSSIPAKPNVPLKQGDVLYEIDPAPYQYALELAQRSCRQARAMSSNSKQRSKSPRPESRGRGGCCPGQG